MASARPIHEHAQDRRGPRIQSRAGAVALLFRSIGLTQILAGILVATGLDSCRSAEPGREPKTFFDSLAVAAAEQTRNRVRYDPGYRVIEYPGGDVPESVGVCTDVLIRAYRAFGIDLQQEVHEDMRSHFSRYPSKRIWGLEAPDSNIDHRRVQNLATFFGRKGEKVAVTDSAQDYEPGDIVVWRLVGSIEHIGIVGLRLDSETKRPLVVHNIGLGPKEEDVLFRYEIIGHYRYGRKVPADGR